MRVAGTSVSHLFLYGAGGGRTTELLAGGPPLAFLVAVLVCCYFWCTGIEAACIVASCNQSDLITARKDKKVSSRLLIMSLELQYLKSNEGRQKGEL